VLISVAAVFIYAPMTLLPLFLQGLMGYSSLDSGLVQVSRGLGALVFMPLAGLMMNRFDARKLVATGFVLLGVSSWMFAGLNLDFAKSYLDWPNFLQGAGVGLCMVPLLTVSMGMLKKEQMGNASGIFALARNLAGSIGISVMTTMVTRQAQFHQATLVAHLTPYDPAYQTATQGARAALAAQVGAAQAPAMADGMVYRSLLQQSGMLAYVDAFWLLTIMCFIAVPLVVLLKRVSVDKAVVAH
jgi:DHA2 family multidrug resistance protein